jgi:hypothetical protein
MDLFRAVYSRDLKIAAMRALELAFPQTLIVFKQYSSPDDAQRWTIGGNSVSPSFETRDRMGLHDIL